MKSYRWKNMERKDLKSSPLSSAGVNAIFSNIWEGGGFAATIVSLRWSMNMSVGLCRECESELLLKLTNFLIKNYNFD